MCPHLINYLTLGFIFGPAVAIPYGLENISPPPLAFAILSLAYLASTPVIFWLLNKSGAQHRYRNRILDKVAKTMNLEREKIMHKIEDVGEHFTRNLGDIGFLFGLTVFSFAFGIYWAGILAFCLKVDVKRATFSVGAGSLLSVLFWWYVIEYSRDVINPTYFSLFFILLALLAFAYGVVRENKVVRRVARLIRETGFLIKDAGVKATAVGIKATKVTADTLLDVVDKEHGRKSGG